MGSVILYYLQQIQPSRHIPQSPVAGDVLFRICGAVFLPEAAQFNGIVCVKCFQPGV
jgi:hypothetical protein